MTDQFTKEELEHDPLLDTYVKTVGFYQQYKTLIIGGGIAVIALLVAIVGYNFYQSGQEEEAQRLMSVAEASFRSGNYEKALKGDLDALDPGFEQIINHYGSTNAGNLAHYYAAIAEYELDNLEVALSYIQGFDVPDGVLGVNALSLHAAILADLKRFPEAAAQYVKAAEQTDNESLSSFHYLKAAQAYFDGGNRDQALKMVNKILDAYPTSAQVNDAKKLRARING